MQGKGTEQSHLTPSEQRDEELTMLEMFPPVLADIRAAAVAADRALMQWIARGNSAEHPISLKLVERAEGTLNDYRRALRQEA